MSKLNIDQKTIKSLFTDKNADFLIPDYQRPYAWGDSECSTLWDDIFAFAIPDDDASKFDTSEEYYLGPIVTFKNKENGKMEVIDGQQRLTTLMLLLRAFYDRFMNMKDEQSISLKETIAKCIWKTDEFEKPMFNCLKINSEVATDNDKDQFLSILRTGDAPESMKSNYAVNFRFFKKKIEEFVNAYGTYLPYLPARILNNCILLPIEAESQNTALRIFSTLNDRGLPLSDSDIFKAQFYKYYTNIGKKDEFIKKWKYLEELTNKIFHPNSGTPMDELFTRYMYFERAKLGIKTSTTEALRKFYEKDKYALLNNEIILEKLIKLAEFWDDISKQDDERFSDRVLKELFVLNYAPNGMWTYFVSVYFMQNMDNNGKLEDDKFYLFLRRTIAFVFTYAITNPGVNALRTPVFTEMINIVRNQDVTFADFKFNIETTRSQFNNFTFYNSRPITKSLLAWWMFTNDNQELIPLDVSLEIEHIYAKNRNEKEHSLNDSKYVEKLGNKAMLEKRINIRASDYRFIDKCPYYIGYTNKRGQLKEGTKNLELLNFAKTKEDYTQNDILSRSDTIIDSFLNFVKDNNLAL